MGTISTDSQLESVVEITERDSDEKKNALDNRRLVHRLHFVKGWSRHRIAEVTGLRRAFVTQWTRSADQDLEADARGWSKGQRRVYDQTLEERVAAIHQELRDAADQFFDGASAVQQLYRERYAGEQSPSLRTIGRVMSALGLSRTNKGSRSKGAAAYLCYPEHTIYTELGERLLEVDFLSRYLTGHSQPLHFLGMSFKKAPKLRCYRRIDAQTSANLIEGTHWFFEEFERPGLLKVDNCLASVGSSSGKRTISRFVKFLWSKQVNPIFAVPRKPFSQASIEGNNSVFARKFWNRRSFESIDDVEHDLRLFNAASIRYSGYQRPTGNGSPAPGAFVPKAYFLRQVQQTAETDRHGFINVLNERIKLDAAYINFFVIAEWQPLEGRLIVSIERDKQLQRLHDIDFPPNPNSKLQP
jgi:transposase